MGYRILFVWSLAWAGFGTQSIQAQEKYGLILPFNSDSTHYVQLTFLNQTWLRYTELNPNSNYTIAGSPVNSGFDIGLRRTRLQLYGRLSDKVFFYMQFGQNNFRFNSPKFQGSFFHDVVSEYRIGKGLELGAGLTGWSGLLRYASPSVGSILSLDAPLYQQATNSLNDQFLRKLSLYAKGKIGKLDYRIALSNPMLVEQVYVDNYQTNFAQGPAHMQGQGYFKYQFFEEESNVTPYHAGTYLGKKKMLTLGAGVIYQQDAMWRFPNTFGPEYHDMLLLGTDVFFEKPLNETKQNAFTLYAAFSRYDFGPNYIRFIGVMNPAPKVNSISGHDTGGNAYPMIGTGYTAYVQAGYFLGKELLPNNGSLQFYAAAQVSSYERLIDEVVMVEGGLNWYIHGETGSKISLNYQNRPVYTERVTNTLQYYYTRSNMIQLQYQVSI